MISRVNAGAILSLFRKRERQQTIKIVGGFISSGRRVSNMNQSMPRLPMIVLFLTASLVGPTAPLASPAAAGKQVPFKGSLQALETYDIQFPTLFVEASGTGNATHLGRFTVTYQVDVDLTTGGGPASIHFVAANGDAVVATGLGQGTPTGVPGVSSIVEIYTITGGTGRFAGATGSFTVERVVNQATGITSGSFAGTIAK